MGRQKHTLVEEQIARWEIQRQASAAEAREFVPPNVITISNEVGSRGLAVAERVAELLDIPVYGRQIVERIATSRKLRVRTVETLDQRALGRLEDYVNALFRERTFDQGDYARALTRTVTALWGHEPCVLVGRGCAHIVSHRHSMAVRIIAPLDRRVQQHSRTEGISTDKARARVARMDAERQAFILKHFSQQIDDPQQYDLVLNTAGLTVDCAAEIVVHAFRSKFGQVG